MRAISIGLKIIKYPVIFKYINDDNFDINDIEDIFRTYNYFGYHGVYTKTSNDRYEIVFYMSMKDLKYSNNIYYKIYFNNGSSYSGGFGLYTFLSNFHTCIKSVESYANEHYYDTVKKQ